VVDHLVPNQVLGFFEFFRERDRGSFLFSKACKSLYRRRFKEIEDAPFAAYKMQGPNKKLVALFGKTKYRHCFGEFTSQFIENSCVKFYIIPFPI